MYCAIIGDIINSRKIIDRNKAQQMLNELLSSINNKQKDNIGSNFTITLGDEFQGVLINADSVIDVIEEINFAMHPVKIRFGIGFGEISTQLNRLQAIGADGSSFYAARDAINSLKVNDKKYEVPKQRISLKVHEIDNPFVELLNTSLSLGTLIEDGWTTKQRNTIELMRENNNNQSQVAKILGINKSSVQKSLAHSKYYSYKKQVESVTKAIKYLWEMQNDK